MKTAGGGFEQCYNGQIAVDMESLLIIKTDTVQAIPHKEFTILTETPAYVAAVHNTPEALTVSFKHF